MKRFLVMVAGLELWTNFKSLLLLATTVFVGGCTTVIWLDFLKAWFSGEEPSSFANIVVGLLLPAMLLAIYVIGFMWLYRRKTSLGKIFLFALMGLIVFFLYVPVLILVERIFQ